jgi:D-glycero-beta-D-manno-heptose-7-phosphate kinase
MLDRYIFGKSKRISPEAPVPVVLVDNLDSRSGGAGNVVLNLMSLGADVTAFGLVGADAAGEALKKNLQSEGASLALIENPNFSTPEKVRVISGHQQVVRIDYEKSFSMDKSFEERVCQEIPKIVAGHDLVAISDYAKGFLTQKILRTLIDVCKKSAIPVICDPKSADLSQYSRSTILKPNLGEAYAAAGLGHAASLDEVARAIFKKTDVDMLLITKSEAGLCLFYPDGTQEDHPVAARQVVDGTGAGDTVLAMLAMCMANKVQVSEACSLANIAASLSVEKVGCARITLSQVAKRCIEIHGTAKIFTSEQLSLVEQALRGQNFVTLELPSSFEISSGLLKAIRSISQEGKKDLVISLNSTKFDEERVHALASLKEVSYINVGPSKLAFSSAIPESSYSYDGNALTKN